MDTTYFHRAIEPVLRRAAGDFPTLVLTGPRQSGKTTVLRHMFPDFSYAVLDNPSVGELARQDPELFLEQYPAPAIFDEIQSVPSLLLYLKQRVDNQRSKAGQYLLTGSQQFPLMQGVTESLAGRTAILSLLSLSLEERAIGPGTSLDLMGALLRGGFPELWIRPEREAALWYASYVQTYLERDVRALRQIGDLGDFQRFLNLAAIRNSQLLSLSNLSRDLGVAVNTVKAWVRVLEASHQIYLLQPFHQNRGKRLVKTPKLYFTDSGLFCHLVSLKDPQHALTGPLGGPLMETAVFGEILRSFLNRGELPRLYFWRTTTGEEIDFIVETAEGLLPVEVKLTKTLSSNMAGPIEKFCELFDSKAPRGLIVSLVDKPETLSRRVRAIPLSLLGKALYEPRFFN